MTSQVQLRRNSQGGPTSNPEIARTFGAYALVQKLRKRLRFNTCLQKDVEVTIGVNEDQSPRVVWDGECNKTEGVLWQERIFDGNACPAKEEWVVVQSRDTEVEILRANFALLYSVICSADDATTHAADITLTYKRHCIVCLGATETLSRGEIKTEIPSKPLVVHSFLGNPDSRVQLFDSLKTKNHDSGFVPGAMPRTKPAHKLQ